MTPEEIYESLTTNPCQSFPTAPRTINYLQGNSSVFGTYPQGASAAYWLARIVDVASILKYPCFSAAADSKLYSETNNDYEYKLCLPFKLLERIDGGAYKESCGIVEAAVAHGFRNSVDTMRACHYVAEKDFSQPFCRMATEYLTYWGWNSIADNMLMLGPDIIPATKGDEPSLTPQDTHEDRSPTVGPMSCWPGNQGVPGAAHGCIACVGEDRATCKSCDCCPPNEGPDSSNPCCRPGTPEYYSECCGFERMAEFEGNYIEVAYWVPSQDGSQRGDILTGRQDEKMYHIGILERKEYGGICNLRNNSADRLKTIDKGLFFEWFQKRNGWNYDEMEPENAQRQFNIFSANNDPQPNIKKPDQIERVRATVPLMLDVSVNSKGGMPSSASDYEAYLRTIKQLLWNGEGVALFSNVGFPRVRDSQGLAYPDRIWYTMYSVIGYDDRRIEFDECVYVLQCPLGDWISGGNPTWGPLPTGAFLVTETVFKEMIKYMNGSDYYSCRATICPPSEDCSDPSNIEKYAGCSSVPVYPNCNPYFCTKRQSAFGMVFALSLNPKFTQDNTGDELLHYSRYIPTKSTVDIIEESKAYCQIGFHPIDDDGYELPIDLEFIWGWGIFDVSGLFPVLIKEGNMYTDRTLTKRVFAHADEHQDIETSPIPINCEGDTGPATVNIQWEEYLGYLKVNVGRPPAYHIINLKGKGCF